VMNQVTNLPGQPEKDHDKLQFCVVIKASDNITAYTGIAELNPEVRTIVRFQRYEIS
jgi:hypothetical protein